MMHKAGFVNIIGNPNVGKSTLMNAWVGEKLSIITSKAQTTRHRILGIVNHEDYQVVLSDTPGILEPAYRLQENMMDFVKGAFQDADILVYMVEVGEKKMNNEAIFEKLTHSEQPLLLLLNKIDNIDQEELEAQFEYWQALIPKAMIYPISALNKFNIGVVFDKIISLLPESPPYYDKDTLTDKSERFFVTEIIREKILKYYKKEIPYSVEIEVEEFVHEEKILKIRAIIFVARDSQKGIIIGHKGVALNKVGTLARRDMEVFFKKKIFLDLYVKVNKDWRDKDSQLKRFGYEN
ncbi:GTPase Era [Flavobacteriales bacterium]|nr:GTPase Era [Flavobacteriales bacterium]